MANEYLTRTPTSTGNRKVFTISVWAKLNNNSSNNVLCDTNTNATNFLSIRIGTSGVQSVLVYQIDSGTDYSRYWNLAERDFSAWSHHLFVFNSPAVDAGDRLSYYINGIKITNYSDTYGTFPQNFDFKIDTTRSFNIFRNLDTGGYGQGELCDYFFIDGQALTPDVFGFNKVGKGYISVGSTQATDFRPGQWVPKTPRVIKTAINNNGGFGVNGFYLPMNDSNNFGADFHCDPNSIITLQENLPQPKCRIDGVGDYTGALRDDPFKQYLVLALPFVSGGLQSGFGDYSAAIKGSGSAKTITNSGVSIASTASYYGSAAYNNATGGNGIQFQGSDFAFGTGDFCVEGWFNVTDSSSIRSIFDTRTSDNNSTGFFIGINSSDEFYTYGFPSGTGVSNWMTPTPGQWNHFAVTRQSNTGRVFINGSCVGIVNMGSANYTESGGTALRPSSFFGNLYTFFGYLQDLRIYKGVAKYTGGFDVPRPYTPVGIATWRAVPDTTANNFATLNPLSSPTGSDTMSNGNLDYTGPSAWRVKRGTIQVPTTGKWYFETRLKGSGSNNTYNGSYAAVGVCTDLAPVDGITGISTSSNLMITDTGIVKNFTTAALLFSDNTGNTGSVLSSGDIISIQIDRDANTYNFLKNGVSISSGTMNITANIPLNVIYISYSNQQGQMTMNFGQNPSFSGNTTAGTFTDTNGKGLFKYQPPSGFLALCEDNLPTPAIANPGRHFRTVLYTGDGNSGRSIVGVGFTPDLVWIKDRNNGAYNHLVSDSVRGSGFALRPSSTNEETASGIRAFNADGFSISSDLGYNVSGNNHVAWCWKAGAGTTSTNTNGSITSVVSVNQDAGFSIVSYPSGQGSNFTIGHGLNKAPKLIISKSRNAATDWGVYFTMLGTNTNWMTLNSTNAVGANNSTLSGGAFMISNATTLQISTGAFANQGTQSIAYCWAEIEGYSKFGSYVGNGSADGPFVYCGFKPAWVMIKNINSATDWLLHDSSRSSTNASTQALKPNSSQIEIDIPGTTNIDFLSNGFKIRNGDGGYNNANTYIFAAFAESPFSTANAK